MTQKMKRIKPNRVKKIRQKLFIALLILVTGPVSSQDAAWTGWVKVDPIVYKDWHHYIVLHGSSGAFESESELVAAVKSQHDSTGVCAPTEVTVTGAWSPLDPISGSEHVFLGLEHRRFKPIQIKTTRGDCSSPSTWHVNVGDFHISTSRGVRCPLDSVYVGIEPNDLCRTHIALDCDAQVGNPCSPATGDKSASETDIQNGSNLEFTRYYHSKDLLLGGGFGPGWRHNYSKKWVAGQGSYGGYLEHSNGTKTPMLWNTQISKYVTGTSNGYVLEKVGDEWVLQGSNKNREIFDLQGNLVRIETNDQVTNLVYTAGALTSVQNEFGQFLNFTYNDRGQISSVTDNSGSVYRYEYSSFGNLVNVIYPDLTPANDSDNPAKTYHYENPDYLNHLTGITDENGNRYATYAYDANGKAISTEHAQTTNPVGQERFELDY